MAALCCIREVRAHTFHLIVWEGQFGCSQALRSAEQAKTAIDPSKQNG